MQAVTEQADLAKEIRRRTSHDPLCMKGQDHNESVLKKVYVKSREGR